MSTEELSAQWDVFSAGETSLAEFVENVLPLSDQATNSSEHGDLPGGKQDDKDKLNGCRKLSADAVAVSSFSAILKHFTLCESFEGFSHSKRFFQCF